MVYRDAGGNLIGAGVFKPVVDGMDGVDIGMVVSPRHRRRGHGLYGPAPQGPLSGQRLAAYLRMLH